MSNTQENLLNEVQASIAEIAIQIKRTLEAGKLGESIQFTESMLKELRNPSLSPASYYVLFMQIFNELKTLEDIFIARKESGRSVGVLYDSVQEADGVLERMYLMATVGSAYIESKEAPAKEVIEDLLEMAKSIQNPLRGLFYRYYLLKKLRDKWPDEENIEDSISLLLQNLQYMNFLWIKMSKQAKKNEERAEVSMLLGENITRLSALKGMSIDKYKNTLQPKLLYIIKKCNDPISQQYLMDSLIQVFPDEYHISTLQATLEALISLNSAVDVKSLLITLIDRLARFAADKEIPLNTFDLFNNCMEVVLDERITKEFKQFLSLQTSFLKLLLVVYPSEIKKVDIVLTNSVKALQMQPNKTIDESCMKIVISLLSLPLPLFLIEVLKLPSYVTLYEYLSSSMHKELAKKIIICVVNRRRTIESLEDVQLLASFLKWLFDPRGIKEEIRNGFSEFEELLFSASKLVHLIDCKEILTNFKALTLISSTYSTGGLSVSRYITPTIVSAIYKLAYQLFGTTNLTAAGVPFELFESTYRSIDNISETYPTLAIKLYLQGALTMNSIAAPNTDLEELGYQFISQPLILYQDELTDEESRYRTLILIIGTIQRVSYFSGNNYESLTMSAVQYCKKLRSKEHQCKCLLMCCHFFYNEVIV